MAAGRHGKRAAKDTGLAVIQIWRDELGAKLHIKLEIPDVFSAKHYFALQELGRVFMDMNRPASDRLHALAHFIRITREA